MPRKKAKEGNPKRARRTGQKKLQCDPLGCEFIVEGFMSECDLSQAEAIRRIIWQWYWLIGDKDRPVIFIQSPDPGSTYEQEARHSLTENLRQTSNAIHKAVEALKRYTTELHDPEEAQQTLAKLKQLAGQCADLYNEARAGIVIYLNMIPPETIVETLKIQAQGGTTTYSKFVLASLSKDGGLE